MSKNMRHLTSIHEAASELHKLLVDTPGYIGIQVLSLPESNAVVVNKQDKRCIVVYVKSKENLSDRTIFNSWPVRYELGA